MVYLHFWAFLQLGPFATPCNTPFSRKKVPSVIFEFFVCSKDQCPLNKNRKDGPPALLGVLSFETVCNVVQCTVLPGKATLDHFLGLLIFKGQRSLKKLKYDLPAYFLAFFLFGTICYVVQCTVSPQKGTLGHFLGFFQF